MGCHCCISKRSRRALSDEQGIQEALQFSTTIENIGGSIYPRVLACFERSDAYRKANDIAWVGWLLKAAEERVKDGDLADIEKITRILARIIRMLPLPTPTLH